MADSALRMTETHTGNVCIVSLSGRIDSSNAGDFMTRLQGLIASGEKSILVDFANDAILAGKTPLEAIHHACRTRFRPILMTTFSALMGAVPIAIGLGGMTAQGRRPLGLVIVGGLIISQILTLYLTPILYLYLEELREWVHRRK